MQTVWKITFTTPDGETRTTEYFGTDQQPTENEVAIGIRDQLLSHVILIDRTPGGTNHSVELLRHHGFEIIGIEKADSPTDE